uniref:Nuclease HARBI1 n=1 Tax=Cajanus cajan TaxID=3821 RepID=A0A151S0Q5_CAJCA|nr:Putative nuclease HARBI1 [Cajanus cajan]
MGPAAFINLCERVRATGLVKDAFQSTVEEQVAKFLHIIGHNVKNDCLGAIDGTHVRVKVGRSDAPRFRGRKDWPTQNVFAACDFDMKFTYVLGGWEGTASDSRILKDVLGREDPLIIPQGKYYLGDAGFMLKGQIITPYRGVRYHLKEYSRRAPQNPRELFNHRHSSLRNVIERTFGVLKKRFPIIASGTEPHYSFDTMTNIVLACCILHNFLRGVDNDESLLAEVDRELMEQPMDTMSTQAREDDHREGSTIRDAIAYEMWTNYTAKPAAAKWRVSSIRYYDLMEELWGVDRATGHMARTVRQARRNIGFDTTYRSPPHIGSCSSVDGTQSVPSTASGGTTGTSSSQGTKRKATMIDVMDAQFDRLTTRLDAFTDYLGQGNALTQRLSDIVERQVVAIEK